MVVSCTQPSHIESVSNSQKVLNSRVQIRHFVFNFLRFFRIHPGLAPLVLRSCAAQQAGPGSRQSATVLSRLLAALCPPAHVHSDFSVNFPQHDQCGRPGWPLCPWPQPRYPPAWYKEERGKHHQREVQQSPRKLKLLARFKTPARGNI